MISGCEKRYKAAFCGCVGLLLLALSCAPQTPADTRAADESAIRDLDTQWSKAAAANDLEGTVSYYSDDASMLPPNAPIAVGKQAIRATWTSLLGSGGSVTWQVSKVEVARSGDLAYLIGVYQVTAKDPQATDRGKLVEVWKKQPDGKWKTVADIYNSDLPLPAMPAKKK
jgi:uncharacterized protein (TIGR02246 family)